MESEEFVTNEYVAACFNVDCMRRDCIKYDGVIRGNDIDDAINNSEYSSVFHKGQDGHIAIKEYLWEIEQENSGEYYHNDNEWLGHLSVFAHHKLSISRDNGTNHS